MHFGCLRSRGVHILQRDDIVLPTSYVDSKMFRAPMGASWWHRRSEISTEAGQHPHTRAIIPCTSAA
eukprot:301758-Pyramimonas_sp.AAC.2